MKTTYTIAAIAMFAVILGMGVLAPAMATKPDVNGEHKIKFCHYQEAKEAIIDEDPDSLTFGQILVEAVPEDYIVKETDKKGKMNGHFKGPADNQVAHHFPVDENDVPIEDGQGDFTFAGLDDQGNPIDLADVNDSEADCLALHDEFNPDLEV